MEFDPSRIEAKFKQHLQYVDDTALIVLKGHLLIEEELDLIISKFVFHPDFLDAASLRFGQKVNLARAVSLSEHENEMWQLAIALSALRNELAHSLESDKRRKKAQALREIYSRAASGLPQELRDPKLADQLVAYWSVAMLLGFLDEFRAEAERFRALVDDMDRVINPHRYKGEPPKASS